jgi:Mg/Co/Ni transporter MgtE
VDFLILANLLHAGVDVDPALASAALVTGFADTFGFLFFLAIAALLN